MSTTCSKVARAVYHCFLVIRKVDTNFNHPRVYDGVERVSYTVAKSW